MFILIFTQYAAFMSHLECCIIEWSMDKKGEKSLIWSVCTRLNIVYFKADFFSIPNV